jgi:uncharacterized protein YkwD
LNLKFRAISLLMILGAAALVASACTAVQPAAQSSTPAPSSPTPAPSFLAGPPYTPSAEPFKPGPVLDELFRYALGLINQDRQAAGLPVVALDFNAAAQKHAQDMLDNLFLSHWGTDGLKPYMRYTDEGGLNYEAENSAFSGPLQKVSAGSNYARLDPRGEVKSLEYSMLNEDASSNWGHRDNILNPWHKRVSLGIAYDSYHVPFVEQFEGDYLEWIQPPAISGDVLSLAGRLTDPSLALKNVNICFDPLPQPLSAQQLNTGAHNYSLGQTLNFLVPPPPPGMFYSKLDAAAIQASTWLYEAGSGRFSLQADISRALASGSGVYTIVLMVDGQGGPKALNNFSIFRK